MAHTNSASAPEDAAPATAAGSERLPDFLIVGAQKSGTTSLQWLLNEHPRLRCLPEMHFFCGEGEIDDLGSYRAQFAAVPDTQLAGEKCPCYMSKPDALEAIAREVPQAKLIALLRDPVRRTYAQYWHERRRRTERLALAEALAADRERTTGGGQGFGYVERSRYVRQLEIASELVGRERLLVLLFEELVADPGRALAQVCEFLGVEPLGRGVEMPRVNAYREYRMRWLFELMYRRSLWRFLPRRAAVALHGALTRERRYPPIDPEIARQLRAELEPDNRRLAEWLDRDLEPWGVLRSGRPAAPPPAAAG